jgi:hypothetical protein
VLLLFDRTAGLVSDQFSPDLLPTLQGRASPRSSTSASGSSHGVENFVLFPHPLLSTDIQRR